MALLELNIYSESLETQQQVLAIMPQQSTKGEIGTKSKQYEKIKTLYLLHGLTDNHTVWLRRSLIESYAQENGICVVMPFADRSFYTNMVHGGKYYNYIAKELPKIVEQMLNVSGRREDRFIAGNSMGGYGALKIGMKECNTFCATAGLSPVVDPAGGDKKQWWNADLKNIFGENINISPEDNLFEIAKECNKNKNKPKIYTCIGKDDFLYSENLPLKQHFEQLNFDYTFIEDNGEHSWEYWNEHIKDVIKWMLEEK